ncbi:MAG: flagellar hook-length control protein FliK [Synergistaceae bacterium]|jgi:hypothetical protein|nr:flagellar hook-length control protein FliK [Synergistaceae bacterium]
MAVQVAPAQARDFIDVLPADGGSQQPAGKPAGGTQSARESFDGILAGAKLAKSMYAARYGMSDEARAAAGKIESFASGLSDDDLSLLTAPISNGAARMRDFADALDAELSEGDVRGAIVLAAKAAGSVSRFDPDIVLGGGSLHKLVEEFLKKFGACQAAKQDSGPAAKTAQPEIPAETLSDGKGVLPQDPAEDTVPVPAEALTLETEDGLPTEGETPALPALADDVLEGVKTEEEEEEEEDVAEAETDAEAKTEESVVPEAALNAVQAETQRAASPVAADERTTEPGPAKPDLAQKSDGLGLTPRRANAASVSKGRELDPQAPGVLKDDDALNKAASLGGFAGELASAARAGRAVGGQETALPAAAMPDATYELRGDNPLGDGVRSVLEFMKNDGINEARIVVAPPSLGRVDVSLQASGTGVEAVFKVDNEALKQLLQQQLDILKTSLEAQGIHVSSLAVDIKNREDQKGRPDLDGGRGKARRAGGISDGDGDDEPRSARIDLERGLLHWVA